MDESFKSHETPPPEKQEISTDVEMGLQLLKDIEQPALKEQVLHILKERGIDDLETRALVTQWRDNADATVNKNPSLRGLAIMREAHMADFYAAGGDREEALRTIVWVRFQLSVHDQERALYDRLGEKITELSEGMDPDLVESILNESDEETLRRD